MEGNLAALSNKIGFRDKLGYALGDVGCSMIFALISSYSMVYYTDVLGIATASLSVMFLVLKVFDGFIDPFLGMFADSRRPTKSGKFKKYLLIFAAPVALSAVFAFLPLRSFGIELSKTQALVYAYVSYAFYVVMYSCVNVPYGSLASVITDDQKGRSSLSTFRTVGGTLGGIPAVIVLPMLIYAKSVSKDPATGEEIASEVIRPDRLFYCVIGLALLSMIALVLSYVFTKERIRRYETGADGPNLKKTLRALLKNRPFAAVSAGSMLLILLSTFNATILQYLGKDYFADRGFITLASFASYLPVAIVIPFITGLVSRLGKKELCSAGLVLAGSAYLALFVLQTGSPVIFLALLFAAGTGTAVISLQVWALVADVIDYQELILGRREEGTTYAIYFFLRTFGNAIALFIANISLDAAGYRVARDGVAQIQPPEVARAIYNISTLVPAAVCFLMLAVMFFWYPLNRERSMGLKGELEKSRGAREGWGTV